jgi:transcription elongation factor GreB
VSKAFKGEDASAAPLIVPPRAPLPAGETNYVTVRGLALLRAERQRFLHERAHRTAASSDDDRERSLASFGQLEALEERIACALLVDSAAQPRDEVRFGARVTLRAESGLERCLTIVGVDEADVATGRIAFVAPLARALLQRRVGDIATVRTPRGEEQWEVVTIDYDP